MIRKWIPLWVIPVLVGAAIGTVWLRLTIVRTTYSIHQADRELRSLQKQREQAELKFAALRSPRRLELLAKTKFGLTQPRADQIVHMGPIENETGSGSSLSKRQDGTKHD